MASFKTPIDELVETCSRPESGDAWDELIRRFGGAIRGAVYETTEVLDVARSHEGRQELVQEVYCRLLENRRRYLRAFRGASESQARLFFVRIARSVVHDHARQIRATKRGGEQDLSLKDKFVPLPELTNRVSPEDSYLRLEQWRNFWRHARDTLRHHPLGRRDLSIFRWYTIEGCSSREISTRLRGSLKPTSVLSVVHRVRHRLGLLDGPPRVAARG